MSLTISKISAAETRGLRQAVLWPDNPPAHCMLEGDETANHFGGTIDGILTGVVSVFADEQNQMRLRKFAILPEFQGQRIGSALVQHVVDYLEPTPTRLLWCDARLEAIPFYKKQGFEEEGSVFVKSGKPYIRMSCRLRGLP